MRSLVTTLRAVGAASVVQTGANGLTTRKIGSVSAADKRVTKDYISSESSSEMKRDPKTSPPKLTDSSGIAASSAELID